METQKLASLNLVQSFSGLRPLKFTSFTPTPNALATVKLLRA